jgi:hypothetical protein
MEIWVPVYGLPAYQVSNLGNIKRIAHVGFHKRYGNRNFQERMLKPAKNNDGYLRLNIGKKHKFVHVIVLESFVGPRPKGMQVCHNNGKPDDNRLENLRWDSPKNNVQDRKKHGTYQYGEKNHQFKYSKELKQEIIASLESAKILAKRLNISEGAIYSIRHKHKKDVSKVVDIS